MDGIPISQPEFKALSSESRARILKFLQERNHTLSELAAKTGMAAPTVKQHMEVLAESGLAEMKDEGRKWKYYSLTRKGQALLGTGRSAHPNILIVLSAALGIALIGLMLLITTASVFQVGSPSAPASGAGNYAETPQITGGIQAENSISAATGSEKSISRADSSAGKEGVIADCRPLFPIEKSEASGEMSASEYYAQKCHESLAKEGCRNLDFYNSSTFAFGDGDGKPDCEWKGE
ncbi:MAG: winged helix-turn-helix transcriptional regulator [Candidatus Diapherotrites archaeon]|uniref:Winged helix-turn-helix transcriptional regulator n=1 Tax=Candidatus Iainarchaeum sp. TaxID=3101447 RepID=A0A8T3YR94_9ARCH|nr:winged helix-turn-helix transcriptional regulator [Candidatus Diapherotrites archaeon]